ncbi:uncharacterized protein LOC109717551 [Ananas comosus]|uniref:Uncharacterized protein LOC109717551 n=1 Tax=Ananas comosus TaxID=4615 RepID=A0A6P5FSS9_ANACO|nr:uncharacterized protein LOC109717551 [Ananas comosus]
MAPKAVFPTIFVLFLTIAILFLPHALATTGKPNKEEPQRKESSANEDRRGQQSRVNEMSSSARAAGGSIAHRPVPPLLYPQAQTTSQPIVRGSTQHDGQQLPSSSSSGIPSASDTPAGTKIVKQAQDVKGQQKAGGNLANHPVPPLYYPDVQTPSQPSVGAASDVRTAVSTTPSSSSRNRSASDTPAGTNN